MATDVKQKATEVYEQFKTFLDNRKWTYKTVEEEDNYGISFSVKGEDIRMEFFIQVDSYRQIISIISPMPFDIKQDKVVEMAMAISIINYPIANGTFDYDFRSGHLNFRIVNSLLATKLDEEFFEYMIDLSCHAVDRYNDKLYFVNEGRMTLEELYSFVHGDK